mmetsp:Transcript_37612/g.88981  ORF Transcript_37612/g.88981 Transcript_37612/m.88981 type:complete len:329 (+) Transcript_37612:688-1674(+)
MHRREEHILAVRLVEPGLVDGVGHAESCPHPPRLEVRLEVADAGRSAVAVVHIEIHDRNPLCLGVVVLGVGSAHRHVVDQAEALGEAGTAIIGMHEAARASVMPGRPRGHKRVALLPPHHTVHRFADGASGSAGHQIRLRRERRVLGVTRRVEGAHGAVVAVPLGAAAGELADVLPVVHAEDVCQARRLHVLLEAHPPAPHRVGGVAEEARAAHENLDARGTLLAPLGCVVREEHLIEDDERAPPAPRGNPRLRGGAARVRALSLGPENVLAERRRGEDEGGRRGAGVGRGGACCLRGARLPGARHHSARRVLVHLVLHLVLLLVVGR